MNNISKKERLTGALWGAVTGDALGVPVEFKSREELKKHPVKEMTGYGTHNQPPGTWSDDTSLMLCTIDSLLKGYDLDDMANLFIRWMNDACMTPYGVVFDIGISTSQAITNLRDGIEPLSAGGADEHDNGNGSLMRILPVALSYAEYPVDEMLKCAHEISSLTHRHPRSQIACGFYCLVAASILHGKKKEHAYADAVDIALKFYHEPPFSHEFGHFKRLLTGSIYDLEEDKIYSSGYVIHTLEAGLWSLLNSGSYEEAVIKAVNLGEDTDTTGIVTGGLAGLYYGLGSIPERWMNKLASRDFLDSLFVEFANKVLHR